MTVYSMVIAKHSPPPEPLPGPLRQRPESAYGIDLFASVYAKQGLERQDIVRFLPGFAEGFMRRQRTCRPAASF